MKKGKLALVFLVIVFMFISLYGKSHTKRLCTVTNVTEDTVSVKHPNGCIYSVRVKDPYNYSINSKVATIFDELTDWEKNYEVKAIHPQD